MCTVAKLQLLINASVGRGNGGFLTHVNKDIEKS